MGKGKVRDLGRHRGKRGEKEDFECYLRKLKLQKNWVEKRKKKMCDISKTGHCVP